MTKSIYSGVLAFIAVSIFCSTAFSQDNVARDEAVIQKGKYIYTPGQNIPTPYSPVLVQLYDNGPMITHPGGGFGGANASALQTAIGLGTYGLGAQISAGVNSVADDFTIAGANWNIDELQFFTYQTGSTTTSTITDLRVQIYIQKKWKNLVIRGRTVSAVIYGVRMVLHKGSTTVRPIRSEKRTGGAKRRDAYPEFPSRYSQDTYRFYSVEKNVQRCI